MRPIVILVEPEYSENIGLIARAMKNFALKDLWLVKPLAKPDETGAISRAMHAAELLKKARIFDSLEKALAEVDFSAATTAICCKDKRIERNAITPRVLAKHFAKTDAKLAIVFGRESNGLTNKELSMCDFIVNIPSSRDYRTLNVSHAAAIIFYELFVTKHANRFESASSETKNTLIRLFKELAQGLDNVRNKEATVASFKHLVARAPITKREANAIIAVLSELKKRNN